MRPPPFKTSLLLFLFLLGFLAESGCSPRPVSRHREEADGTFTEILIGGKTKPERERVIAEAFQLLRQIDAKLNRHIQTSEVSRINQEGFARPPAVSAETFTLIQSSVELFQKSGGAFDITLLPLLKLWGFGEPGPRLPRPEEIQGLLAKVDSNLLILDAKKHRVGFRIPGMGIDLASVAKGYACDQAIEFLRARGVQDALVNVGGTIRVIGHSPEGKPWRVGLRHPRDPTRTLQVISLVNEAVSTRGDYEEFFVAEGRRYSNLLNPRTGYPASESVEVSVIAPSAFLADALAAGLFVLGPQKASQFTRQFPGARWYLTYFANGDHFKTLSSDDSVSSL